VGARGSSLDPTVLGTSFTVVLPQKLGAETVAGSLASFVATGLTADSSLKAAGAVMPAVQASPFVVHSQILSPVRQEGAFLADSTPAGSSQAAPSLPAASVSRETAAPTYLDESFSLPSKAEMPANSSLPCDDYFATWLDQPQISEAGSFNLSHCKETAGGTSVFAAALVALLHGQRVEWSDRTSERKRVPLRA
jgi:hypothetical protein